VRADLREGAAAVSLDAAAGVVSALGGSEARAVHVAQAGPDRGLGVVQLAADAV
jgi:hypothetical protein